MHRLAAALLALLLPVPASAALLPFTGKLSIEFSPQWQMYEPCQWGSCPAPLRFAATQTGVADVELTTNGGLAVLVLPDGSFLIDQAPVLYTLYFRPWPFLGIAVDLENGPGSFGPTGGAMPLPGVLKVCLFGRCGSPTNSSNLSVPLSVVGAGGTATLPGPINVTVFGAPWTTGTLMITTPFGTQAAFTVQGSAGPRTLNLVTPIFFSTNVASIPIWNFAYARLQLTWVPEPGTALLLGGGLAGLGMGVAGRRRRR